MKHDVFRKPVPTFRHHALADYKQTKQEQPVRMNDLRARCGLVAVTALVSAAATYGVMTFVGTSEAQSQPAPTQRIDVMTQPLADIPGRREPGTARCLEN